MSPRKLFFILQKNKDIEKGGFVPFAISLLLLETILVYFFVYACYT